MTGFDAVNRNKLGFRAALNIPDDTGVTEKAQVPVVVYVVGQEGFWI